VIAIEEVLQEAPESLEDRIARLEDENEALRWQVAAFEDLFIRLRRVLLGTALKSLIAAGVEQTIRDHGPITRQFLSSAARRVRGQMISFIDAEFDQALGPGSINAIKLRARPKRYRR